MALIGLFQPQKSPSHLNADIHFFLFRSHSRCVCVYSLVCLLDFISVSTSTTSECASDICKNLTRKNEMWSDTNIVHVYESVWWFCFLFYFRLCVFIRTNWRRLCFVDGDIFFRSDIFSKNGSFAPEKNTYSHPLTHTHAPTIS